MFGGGFSGTKTKTALRLLVGRIKLLSNKKEQQLKAARRELADLLAAGKTDSARIRVEGLMREERLVCAYEILDLFSELLLQRLPVMEKARELPAELTEAVATLAYCSARCAQELPELATLRQQLASKYGAPRIAACCGDDTAAAAGVHDRMMALLAVAAPPPALKLARLGEIVAEHGVAWDAESASKSILKAPPDLIAVPGSEVVWEAGEAPGPHMAGPAPAVGSPSPLFDGWFAPSPAGGAAGGPKLAAVPPLTPLPPAPAPARAASGGEEEAAEEEYADAAAAARCAARSAEKAAHAAKVAARLASPPAASAAPAISPAAAGGVAAESEPASDDSDDEGVSLPSPPTSAATTPAATPEPHAPPPPQPPAASEVDELDELTKRFEALKRRM